MTCSKLVAGSLTVGFASRQEIEWRFGKKRLFAFTLIQQLR